MKQKRWLAKLSGIFIKWYFEQIPSFGHRALDPDLVKTESVTMTKNTVTKPIILVLERANVPERDDEVLDRDRRGHRDTLRRQVCRSALNNSSGKSQKKSFFYGRAIQDKRTF